MLEATPLSLTGGMFLSASLCIGLVVSVAGCLGLGGRGHTLSGGGWIITEHLQKNFPDF